MKIGIVLSKTPSYSETFFLSKIEGLKASGFDVTLFVQKKDSNFSLCEVKIAPAVNKHQGIVQLFKTIFVLKIILIRAPKSFLKFIKLERKSGKSWLQTLKNGYNNAHILKTDQDWLHFGFTTIAIQSEHVSKAIGAKMAVSFRGFDLTLFPSKNPNCYDLVWKNVDKVHAISNYLMQTAYDLDLPKDIPFSIITPAVDSSKFDRERNANTHSLNIITIARLHWIKGLSYVIEALAKLKEKQIDFTYTIVGKGPEYQNIVDLIEKYNLQDNVFLEGEKSHDEVISYLKKSNIYIQYSDVEGFCNAVLEAQAMGLLCLVSDGGALPENVLHEETGWVIPKKNPAALANTILKIIDLPGEIKNKISRSARERVISSFNLNAQWEKFKAFYEDN